LSRQAKNRLDADKCKSGIKGPQTYLCGVLRTINRAREQQFRDWLTFQRFLESLIGSALRAEVQETSEDRVRLYKAKGSDDFSVPVPPPRTAHEVRDLLAEALAEQ
jgi:hypothetical protein